MAVVMTKEKARYIARRPVELSNVHEAKVARNESAVARYLRAVTEVTLAASLSKSKDAVINLEMTQRDYDAFPAEYAELVTTAKAFALHAVILITAGR